MKSVVKGGIRISRRTNDGRVKKTIKIKSHVDLTNGSIATASQGFWLLRVIE
ncbi:MAG: hypothetical protein JW878_09450 [Methanomicrobia archaeon]|nr:hypothetical protein [Methanomicrobia archaeon]